MNNYGKNGNNCEGACNTEVTCEMATRWHQIAVYWKQTGTNGSNFGVWLKDYFPLTVNFNKYWQRAAINSVELFLRSVSSEFVWFKSQTEHS